jgi:SAM-dependent methyltransferase
MSNSLDQYVKAYQGNDLYDFDNQILLTWYPKRVLHYAGAARSLLELGLGHGYAAEMFSQRFERHLVLEGSPAVISNFREKYPDCKVEIVESWFENFATDERFDLIVMGFILEHVDDPVFVLRYFRRFLAPGGRIFVAVPNAEVMNRKLGYLAGMLPNMQQLSEHDYLQGHQRYYTVHTLKMDLEESGYRIKFIEGIYLKPLTTSQMLSLKLDPKIINALCQMAVDYPELSCGIMAELVLEV